MTTVSDPRQSSVLLVGLVLSLLALCGGLYRWVEPSKALPELPVFWKPGAQETREYVKTDGSYPLPSGEEGKSVLAAFQAWNEASPEAELEERRRSLTQLEEEARRFFQRHGREGYRALGLVAWSNFSGALQRQDGPTANAWGMGILEEANRTGLVGESGDWKDGSWLVLRMLYMQGWATLLQHTTPVDTLLLPLERSTIPKWKAEAHADWGTLPWEARLRYASEAYSVDPSYPVHFVRGMIFSRSGLFQQALAEMTLSLERGEGVSVASEWMNALRQTGLEVP